MDETPLDPKNICSDGFMKQWLQTIAATANSSNSLPESNDFKFFKTTSSAFEKLMQKEATTLLNSISSLQLLHNPNETSISDIDDLGEQFDSTVDILDQLFENIDIALDEASHPENKKDSFALLDTEGNEKYDATQQKGKQSLKPQLKWTDVDNSNTPFVPKLKTKPNSKKSLRLKIFVSPRINFLHLSEESLDRNRTNTSAFQFELENPFKLIPGTGVGGPVQRDSYPHPYEFELSNITFAPEQFLPAKDSAIPPISKIPCVWVDTEKALHDLQAKLEISTEFAIDLESHSYRSFQGFVCLMQISTRDTDYLVDTLELREHLQCLNTSFTNPRIVKVMHGADLDILWLQRDFGLYIVNMFDTGQAARLLQLSKFSLAFLLKHYCNVEADKKYQLADWRIRPLPSEMVRYAREDTHYLLYIYDRLRNDILVHRDGPAKLQNVLLSSKFICLRRYEKERFTETSYLSLITKHGIQLQPNNNNTNQKDTIRLLYKWRDLVARAEDESIKFVLPTHILLHIAEVMPTDVQKLLQCCNPVTKLVRRDALLLVRLIDLAKKGQADNDELISGLLQSVVQSTTMLNNFISTPQATPQKDSSKDISMMSETNGGFQSPLITSENLYQIAGWVEDTSQRQYYQTPSITINEKDLDLSMDGGSNSFFTSATTNKFRTSLTPASSSMLFRSISNDSFMKDETPVANKTETIRRNFSIGNIQSPNRPIYQTTSTLYDLQQHNIMKLQSDNVADISIMEDEPVTTTVVQPPAKSTVNKKQQQQTIEIAPKSLYEEYEMEKKNTKKKGNNNNNKNSKSNSSTNVPLHKNKSATTTANAKTDFKQPQTKKQSTTANASTTSSSSSNNTTNQEDTSSVEFMKKIGWIHK